MFSQDEFAGLAEHAVLFMHLMTRIEGVENDDMLLTKGGTGFPTFMAMDENEQVLARLDGPRTMEGFTSMMTTEVEEFRTLRAAAAESGKPEDMAAFFLKRLQIGGVSGEDIEAAMKEFGEVMTEAQMAEAKGALAKVKLQEILGQMRTGDLTKEQVEKSVYDMWKEGMVPSGSDRGMFMQVLSAYGESQKDVEALDAAIAAIEEMYGARAKAFVDRLKEARAAIGG